MARQVRIHASYINPYWSVPSFDDSGKDIGICADIVTPRDYVNTVQDVTGRNIVLIETDETRFDKSKDFAEELYNKCVLHVIFSEQN